VEAKGDDDVFDNGKKPSPNMSAIMSGRAENVLKK
jgi:hypothetical protein